MIVVTGATGFIGKHLIPVLSQSVSVPIRACTRQHMVRQDTERKVEYFQGDITDRDSLREMLEPGATLINLAYSNTNSLQDAIVFTTDMVEAAAEKGIKRFIHCSSISVYGRVDGVVTEHTPCDPQDEYGRIKLLIEQTLLKQTRDRFELIILRPSEVFGTGGKTLVSLIDSILMRNQFINYIRSVLYGRRRTHLVPVATVIDAIRFLCTDERKYKAEIFNVTADEDTLNNFRDIEELLIEELDLPHYSLPSLSIPRFVLESVMCIAGRSTIDTQVLYSSQKLKELGFCTSHDLEQELRKFAKTHNKTSGNN